MTDDPGVMGNLPRSRPGRRSSKRGGSTGGADPKPATEVTASSAAKPKPAAGAKSAAGRPTARKPAAKRPAARKTTAGSTNPTARGRASASQRKPAAAEQPPRQEEATHGSTDPVTGAVLLAGKLVEGGLKVAGGIVKRLPRP